MALVLNDRVRETTIVVGTGTATLLGAAAGYQSFSVIGNANTCYYCISDQGGANWEVGIGTYTASGTTLARTTVLSSSNAGALVTFTAGIKDVFVTYPSSKGLWKDASGNAIGLGTPASGVVTNLTGTASININGTVGATTATTGAFTNLSYTGTFTGGTGVIAIGTNQIYKDASGNVGIGTSVNNVFDNVAAARPLVVQSSSSATTPGSSTNAITISNSDTTTNNVSQLNFAAITGANTNQFSSAWIACQYGARTNGQYPAGTLIFATSTTLNNAPSERVRIDNSGNVGIGTSSPTGKLDVAGTIKTLGYTVATLPTGVTGARAYVTDALAPVFGATVVTGGAVTIPVFYNGTNWIVG